MWAEYNHSAYPIVEVNMKGNIKSDKEFKLFTDEWLSLFEKKRDFVLIFDTRNVGWVSPRYAFMMADFITLLKKRCLVPNLEYLKRACIIVDSWWIKSLLWLIFYLEEPICPIDYYDNTWDINIECLLEEANRNLVNSQNKNSFK